MSTHTHNNQNQPATGDWAGTRSAFGWTRTAGPASPAEFNQQSGIADLKSTYLHGLDLSGTLGGEGADEFATAGGIGGMLAATTARSDSPVSAFHFHLHDGNGNVANLVDPVTAESVAAYEYSPFGKTLVAHGPLAETNPFRFSAKYTDTETGLLYYGYRYYEPALGRWINRDPLAEHAFLAQFQSGLSARESRHFARQSRNPAFRFVGNDPVLLVDLLGLANPCSGPSCLCCMIYAEARGTNAACQRAVGWVIRNRINNSRRSFCDVVSEGDGRQFNGYTTKNYSNCCKECVPNKDISDYRATMANCSMTAPDPTAGAQWFHDNTIPTPTWIVNQVAAGNMEEVAVSGCSSFRFYRLTLP